MHAHRENDNNMALKRRKINRNNKQTAPLTHISSPQVKSINYLIDLSIIHPSIL